MHRVHVQENLVTEGMLEWDLSILMSFLYYDLSSDGLALVTLVEPEQDQVQRGDFGAEERLTVFTLYETVDCIPDYQHLPLNKGVIAKESVQR